MNKIRTLIQYDEDKSPLFVALKSYIGTRQFWYRLLSLGKSDSLNWRANYEEAVNNDSWGPELYRIIGKPPFSDELVAYNCIYFSFTFFILCEEIVVEVDNNHLFLQNASIFINKGDGFEQVNSTEDLYLNAGDTPLTIEDYDLVEELNNESAKVVSYNEDGCASFSIPFEILASIYNQDCSHIGASFMGLDYDDLEGLIEVSPYWGINNNFTWD